MRSRNRGSVYVLVLGASVLVLVIGVSAILAARVVHRASIQEGSIEQARTLALAAIDRGLLIVRDNPTTWRTVMDGSLPTNVSPGRGTYTLQVLDPIDGIITDSEADPVILTGVGKMDSATYKMRVTLYGDGRPMAGSWKRVVD